MFPPTCLSSSPTNGHAPGPCLKTAFENALKFHLPEGGQVTLRILHRGQPVGSSVNLRHPPGIREGKNRNRNFPRPRRSPQKLCHHIGIRGGSLSVVRRITEPGRSAKFGVSEPGEGACFHLHRPDLERPARPGPESALTEEANSNRSFQPRSACLNACAPWPCPPSS